MFNLREKLEQALLICRNEWNSLLWLILVHFVTTSGSIAAFSGVNALFIKSAGIDKLPVAFIIASLVMIPYFLLYLYMENKFSRKGILTGSFIAYGIAALVSGLLLRNYQGHENIIIAVFVMGICILMLVNFQYWSLANLIYHPRQGKRLFPLLGLGGTIGAILTGFSIQLLVEKVGVVNLIYYWSASFFVSAVLIHTMFKKSVITTSETRKKVKIRSIATAALRIFRHIPILKLLIAIHFLVSFVSMYLFIEFSNAVGDSIPSGAGFENHYAEYLGVFNGALYLAVLLGYQLFFTSRIVTGLGIIRTLYLQPALIAVPLIFAVVYGNSPLPLLAAYFINVLCLATFFKTASETIYGSIPEKNRDEAMSFTKIIITPLSIGLSGLLLMWLVRIFPVNFAPIINYAMFAILALWVYLIWNLRGQFVESLFNNFSVGGGKGSFESLLSLANLKSQSAVEILRRTIKGGSESTRIFALEVAGEMKLELLRDDIVELLENDNPKVRHAAIDALGDIGGKEIYPKLMKIYKAQLPQDRLFILENLLKIDPWTFEINAPLLLPEEEDMVAGFLLAHIWKKRNLNVEQQARLQKLFSSDVEKARVFAARCLSMDKDGKFKWDLAQLLKDPSPDVLKEAAASAGILKAEETIPNLIELLEHPDEEVVAIAGESLIKAGKSAADAVRESIVDDDPPLLNETKLNIIVKIGGHWELDYLIQCAETMPPEVIDSSFVHIARVFPKDRKLTREQQKAVQEMVDATELQILDYLRAACSLLSYGDYVLSGTLSALLTDRIISLKKIILCGLHLLNPEERILKIMENIFSGDIRKKNIAVEALENVLPAGYRKTIIPLFDKDTLHDEITCVRELFDEKDQKSEEILKIINKSPDEWLKAWIYLAAGKLGLKSWKEELEFYAISENKLIAEHASLGLKHLTKE
ncbi:MAG: HEAT repeat domain-containing protein [Firmicutes bacterium]|nr:HEAT repeat domain-containing protein [Bacillota bacterium]